MKSNQFSACWFPLRLYMGSDRIVQIQVYNISFQYASFLCICTWALVDLNTCMYKHTLSVFSMLISSPAVQDLWLICIHTSIPFSFQLAGFLSSFTLALIDYYTYKYAVLVLAFWFSLHVYKSSDWFVCIQVYLFSFQHVGFLSSCTGESLAAICRGSWVFSHHNTLKDCFYAKWRKLCFRIYFTFPCITCKSLW